MPAALTPKQEAFARAYVETGNASEAYRQAYEVAETTKPESVWSNASQVLADTKVAQRVMELQEAARERTLVTIEALTKELDEDRELARQEKQPSAAISAVMGKAKLHGLIIDKADNKTKLSADESIAGLLTRIATGGGRLVNDGSGDQS